MNPSVVTEPIRDTLRESLVPTLVTYAQIDTLSDPSTKRGGAPSTERQWDLIRKAEQDLRDLGLEVEVDSNGYLYGFLRGNASGDPLGLLAHVDTTKDVPELGVKPRVIAYDGGPIRYPDDSTVILDPETSPRLRQYIGGRIVTASGKTLLGADDKAGMSEIVSCLRVWVRHPELPRPDIYICFTHDEEIGSGIDDLNLAKLPPACYTLDGGEPGSMEIETWNAYGITIRFKGVSAHAGKAKGHMHNATWAMAEFMSDFKNSLPLAEQTEGREGFCHITDGSFRPELCQLQIIMRDFDESVNQCRIEAVRELAERIAARHPPITVECDVKFQYPNMIKYIEEMPSVRQRAIEAIRRNNLELKLEPIRGGTDGSKLSAVGHPCPNLGTGMENIHSRTEWIAEDAMVASASVLLDLAKVYTEQSGC